MQCRDFLLTLIHQLHNLYSKSFIFFKSGHWQYSPEVRLTILSYAGFYFFRIPLIDLKLGIEAPLIIRGLKLSHSIISHSAVLQLQFELAMPFLMEQLREVRAND